MCFHDTNGVFNRFIVWFDAGNQYSSFFGASLDNSDL